MTMEDWMFIVNRFIFTDIVMRISLWFAFREGVEVLEMVQMLSWFNKKYKTGVRREEFRAFFPAIGTGQHLADMVFR